jgi:hypothetical protein
MGLSRKNPSQKRAGTVAQGVGPEFKPQYCKKKKVFKNGGQESKTGPIWGLVPVGGGGYKKCVGG